MSVLSHWFIPSLLSLHLVRTSNFNTHDYLLVTDGNSGNGLITCTDSDWAGSPEYSKSTTRFYIKLANTVFLWNSHQQKTAALSYTEAEYMALSNCSCQITDQKHVWEDWFQFTTYTNLWWQSRVHIYGKQPCYRTLHKTHPHQIPLH